MIENSHTSTQITNSHHELPQNSRDRGHSHRRHGHGQDITSYPLGDKPAGLTKTQSRRPSATGIDAEQHRGWKMNRVTMAEDKKRRSESEKGEGGGRICSGFVAPPPPPAIGNVNYNTHVTANK